MLRAIARIIVFMLGCIEVSASLISINTSSIPSTQGWQYITSGQLAGYSETSIYTVTADSVLSMNTMVATYLVRDPGDAMYSRSDVVSDAGINILEWTSRTLAHEWAPGHPLGFCAGFTIDNKQCTLGILSDRIALLGNSGYEYFYLDATEYHTYRLEAFEGASTYNLYVDGTLTGSTTLRSVSVQNRVFVGDGTGGANARVELSDLQFEQIPEPTVISLMGLFGVGLLAAKRLFQ